MRKRSQNNWFSYVAILASLITSVSAAGFYDDNSRGWFFYETKPVESAEVIPPKVLLPAQIKTPGEQAESDLAELQKELKQASALAIMDPTPENAWAYQQIKTKIFDMSSVLADVQMQNEWQRPDSYISSNPTGGEGLSIDRTNQNHCSADMIKQSGNVWGMFLFVSKDCKYCNAQVNVQKQITRTYAMTAMVIGFDNIKPANIDDLVFAPDNGISKKFNIQNEGKPVTVMFNVKTGQSKVLGYGYIPIDGLNERICHLYTKRLGEI